MSRSINSRINLRDTQKLRWASAPVLFIVLLFLVLLSNPVFANPADVFGFSPRASAMAQAAVAVSDDSSANYYNPAGLARQGDLRIDIGYQAAHPSLSINGHDSHVDSTSGFLVGISAPGQIFGTRIAFGAALFLPDDRISRTRSLAYAQPRWENYDNRTQRIFLAANLAIKLPGGVSVGGGIAFMSRTRGTVQLRGVVGFSDPEADTRLFTDVNVDLLAVRYPQVGVAWEVTRYLTLAASYRHSFSLQLEQTFSIHGDVGNVGVDPIVKNGFLEAKTASTDLFQPGQLTVGGALRVTPRLLLAFDLVWARWSDFTTPASNVSITLDVGPQLNPLVHLPPPRTYPSPGFHDILIPRLGVEARALERHHVLVDVRGGYSYEASPVPNQSGESNLIDCDKHHLTVGLGVTLQNLTRVVPRPLAIDVHLATTVLAPRATHKIDPLDPVGDYVAGGAIVEWGVMTRWAF